MYIGLISDSHGIFSREFRDFLAPVDEIWHAGDFGGGLVTAAEIAAFKPLVGVSGNCDDRILLHDYPEYRCWECGGMKVLMTHIGGTPGHYDRRALNLITHYDPDHFICGHSHILRVQYDHRYGFLYVNPGACGLQGWHAVRTALRFKVEGGAVSGMEVFNLQRH